MNNITAHITFITTGYFFFSFFHLVQGPCKTIVGREILDIFKRKGVGVSNYSKYVMQLHPTARILLTAMFLYDPKSEQTFDINMLMDAMNTYLSQISVSPMKEEEVHPAMEQLLSYGMVLNGNEEFGRRTVNSFVSISIIYHIISIL